VTVASVIPVIFSGSIIEALGVRILLLVLSVFCMAAFFVSRRFGDKFMNG
jgi:hypothetical protein